MEGYWWVARALFYAAFGIVIIAYRIVRFIFRLFLLGAAVRKYHKEKDLYIPEASRFEHTHVVAGTGHGKTQLLQQFLLWDLLDVEKGEATIIVIDSQGDMIKNIMRMKRIEKIADRLILIDPNDIEYPPALNLFDFDFSRFTLYSAVDREKFLNGAIELYGFLFGALFGAELTARQGMIFRYLARLMMVVPGATIMHLMRFLGEPEAVLPYIEHLDRISQAFFKTQFFAREYDDTRQQLLTRLWIVLSNSVLERMFAHEKNAVSMYPAMNKGSLILINTAKDLLKSEGSELLGRFFISLISQATQERAAIEEGKRMPTYVYIDEAQDYFDASIEEILTTARKYKVGLTIAHQSLAQLKPKLEAIVFSNTSVKIVGGLSAHDEQAFAREMHCEPELFHETKKQKDLSKFVAYVKNVTPEQKVLNLYFGVMEKEEKLSPEAAAKLLADNRRRVALPIEDLGPPSGPAGGRIAIEKAGLGRPDPI